MKNRASEQPFGIYPLCILPLTMMDLPTYSLSGIVKVAEFKRGIQISIIKINLGGQ